MLPYTTYHIPETPDRQTGISGQWLWLIVRNPLSAAEEDLLQKIATALKADLSADVHRITFDPAAPVSLSTMSNQQPKLVVSFGVPPADLGLWIDMSRTGMCKLESLSFILTLPIDELAGNPTAKKALWNSMLTYMEELK